LAYFLPESKVVSVAILAILFVFIIIKLPRIFDLSGKLLDGSSHFGLQSILKDVCEAHKDEQVED